MNFFHHKGLGNHLLQLWPKVVKHPVYCIPTFGPPCICQSHWNLRKSAVSNKIRHNVTTFSIITYACFCRHVGGKLLNINRRQHSDDNYRTKRFFFVQLKFNKTANKVWLLHVKSFERKNMKPPVELVLLLYFILSRHWNLFLRGLII